jgi:DNA sulfur modification protein DndD
MADEVTKQGGAIRALSTLAENNVQSLATLTQNHVNIRSHLDRLYTELEHIKEELRSMPQDNIGGLEKQRTEFQRLYDRLLNDQGVIISELNNIEKYVEHITHEKETAQAKEAKLDTLTRSEALAKKAAEAISILKSQVFEETRMRVEKETQSIFEQLAWKQDHFQSVNIDSEFRLEVIDRWGTPTREALAAGERQILSLSFICAMAKVSGEEAPLVIDTPFGRLSSNHLSAVAQKLPDLTPQLILFVTDREWDVSSQEGLGPRTGRQYKLHFDNSTGCTTIEEMD